MKPVHHTTKSSTVCPKCNQPLTYYWYDAEERNGHGNRLYGGVCEDCYRKRNKGRPPLGLKDLNEIRRRGITNEQYYKEHGY